MRTNEKCDDSHAPSTSLNFPSEPNIPEGPEYEKISTLYRCTGRSFTNSTQKQRQLLKSRTLTLN